MALSRYQLAAWVRSSSTQVEPTRSTTASKLYLGNQLLNSVSKIHHLINYLIVSLFLRLQEHHAQSSDPTLRHNNSTTAAATPGLVTVCSAIGCLWRLLHSARSCCFSSCLRLRQIVAALPSVTATTNSQIQTDSNYPSKATQYLLVLGCIAMRWCVPQHTAVQRSEQSHSQTMSMLSHAGR